MPQVALECVRDVARDPVLKLKAPDSMVLRTFNGNIPSRVCCHPDKFDYKRMIVDIAKDPGDTSKTRVWDGMGSTLANMLEHPEDKRYGKDVVRFMLLLTDGGDNASKDTVDAFAAKLSKATQKLSNLHVVIMAVGLGAKEQADFERLVSLTLAAQRQKKLTIKVVKRDSASDVNIRDAFVEALDDIRALIHRDAAGRVTVNMLRTRDRRKVQQMDQAAAKMAQSYKTTQLLSAADLTNGLKNMFLTN
ncbi:hypothetical protein HYH03_008874 [Edaphochlamys debaryana]|uniref:VWFA domain-containing protein n=1 Tax=Edaphochlamys debaryana TaxID=47281 RepID=A0A835Y0G1_9CHLO|nr:hypothetical protein HYH03_008874 [Edaphochlamys debaryana]|eukprot:KAG2492967.1 hypothetical protein HYH03_008874 [Edaphochlamys debaryana]